MTKTVLRVVVLAALLVATPARAQDQGFPFDPQLDRLAEILGSLQYLRQLCGYAEGQVWRDEMQALLKAEAPSGDRHARFVASYNRGYSGFQQMHRTCTPAADVAIRRYLAEGAKISRDLTARYGN